MCGIVGVVGQTNALPQMLDGLQRLEYRGYDSAGVSFINPFGRTVTIKSKGNVDKLKGIVFADKSNSGATAIAHTRWATHGKVTSENAHPHRSGSLSLVHNGIIENYDRLRAQLIDSGYVFKSETDSEVVVHLLHDAMKTQNTSLQDALFSIIPLLEGAYGILVMDESNPNELLVARSGSPMIIGIGEKVNGESGMNFVSSDELSLHEFTNKFVYLDEGDFAKITSTDFVVFDRLGVKINKTIRYADVDRNASSKGEHDSFMAKEMDEQPIVIKNLIDHHFSSLGDVNNGSELGPIGKIIGDVDHIHIVACGTSFHSGLIAKDLFETELNISTSVEVASEYRYRKVAVPKNTLLICISQSGETADTLAALNKAKKEGLYVSSLAICNVPTSSMIREAEYHMLLRAGVEVGVASTKAFTMQLVAFMLITISAMKSRGLDQNANQLFKDILKIPALCRQTIALKEKIEVAAQQLKEAHSCLFLGRGQQTAIALEGALKLKELSYIHAQGYAAGELKHGPLALVDEHISIIATAPADPIHSKLASNIEEVNARGGNFIIFADRNVDIKADNIIRIDMPDVPLSISSIIYAIPLQYLSYFVAKIRGENVDQPRNLAKSVTTE